MSRKTQIDQIAFWVLLGILVMAFLWLLRPFLATLFIAVVFALVMEPIFRFFLKLLRGKRYLATSVTMITLFLFLAIPLAVLAGVATHQILNFVPTVGTSLNEFLHGGTGSSLVASTTQWLQQKWGLEVDIANLGQEAVQRISLFLYQFSPQVIAQTTNMVAMTILSMVLTYFLLADGPRLYSTLLAISPLRKEYEQALSLEITTTVRSTVYGYVMTAFVQAVLAWIACAVAGLGSAPLLALATFLMAFIPIVGAAGVWIPVSIYLLIVGSYGYGIFMILYGILIISGIDNILKPLLIRGKTKVHPVLLFLAILGGFKLWGPIGVLAGPTLVAVLLATLKIYQRDFLA